MTQSAIKIRKGDATRARILEEAVNQASVRGLAAVSLMDVAEAVGLSKSGLFKHFEAKEALHRAVLETAVERFVEEVWSPAAAAPPGRPRLDRLFEGWLDWSGDCWRGGCPLMAAARELQDQPGPLRDYVLAQMRRLDVALATTVSEMNPGLSAEAADQAAFEIAGVISGYGDRIALGDAQSRPKAVAAYRRLAQSLGG